MKTNFTALLIIGLFISPIFSFAQISETKSKDLCTIEDFPYIEDFEDGVFIPLCWEQYETNDHNWIFNDDSGEGAYNGDHYAMFDHEEYGDIGMIVTPFFDLTSLASPKLSFWHSQQAYGDDQDELKVYYRISESAEWEILPGGTFDENIPTWTEEEIYLPNPSATYQIGFEALDDYGYGVRLDYVVVSGSSCSPPSDISISNVTENAANLSWSPAGDETMWNLIISQTPVDDFGSASIIDIEDEPLYNIVGMQNNTKYYIYIQAKCSEDDLSSWVETSVLTDCAWFVDLPLEQNFDDSWTNWCWRIVDNDNDGNTWTKAANHIDPLSGISTAYGSGNQDDYLILPKMNLQDNYLLKWFDVVETSDHNNTYEVMVSTTNSDIESFTTIGTYDCTNENWTQHEASLNDFNGETIYVAFHQTYSSSLVHGFGIDNVQIVEGISGIEDNGNKNDISLYPNPNNGLFKIDFNSETSSDIKINILDITGRVIENRILNNSSNSETFDLSYLNKGVYLIQITINKEQIIKRISIE